jgi:hypothetical protein
VELISLEVRNPFWRTLITAYHPVWEIFSKL